MTFLVMFSTLFGFSEESEEMMGEGDRLDTEDLGLEGERGVRVVDWEGSLRRIPYVIRPNKAILIDIMSCNPL